MSTNYLHDVIVNVLRESGKPLSVKAIDEIISRQKLWQRPSDDDTPPIDQIRRRVNKYKDLFTVTNGEVSLKLNKRLLRLTWNSNGWELPCGHKWNKKDQEKASVAYENQYGFGGEEWLFNPRYNINRYQYGYIRGLMDVTNMDFIDEAYLFTINPLTKDRELVGKIKNLELLEPTDPSQNVSRVYDKFFPLVVKELKDVGADYNKIYVRDFYPVVKFKMEDATLFGEPIIINELKADRKYNRFKPYIVDGELQNLLDGVFKKRSFSFNAGRRKNDNSAHSRSSSKKTVFIPGLHADIIKELEQFLKSDFDINKGNISIEKTEFGENIADIVLEHKKNHISIAEVKTSNNARYNIREALGQLIDYALWHDDVKVERLIIVAPSILSDEHKSYFERIQKSINIKIEYWQYVSGGSEKFKKVV